VREQEHRHGERAVPRPPDRREGRRPPCHSGDQPRPVQRLAALVSQKYNARVGASSTLNLQHNDRHRRNSDI
jgi:hypothetical protein